jgi:hypothetical protein
MVPASRKRPRAFGRALEADPEHKRQPSCWRNTKETLAEGVIAALTSRARSPELRQTDLRAALSLSQNLGFDIILTRRQVYRLHCSPRMLLEQAMPDVDHDQDFTGVGPNTILLARHQEKRGQYEDQLVRILGVNIRAKEMADILKG